VYVTGSADDAVAAFCRDAATGALTFLEVQKDGVGGVDGLWFANSVTVSPDGTNVYATGERDGAVAVFSRDGTTGALTFVEVQKDGEGGVDGLRGASSVTVSPDGARVYVTGSADDAVAVFSRNETTGELTFLEVHKDGIGGVDGLDYAKSVTVSPDGAHVYAAGWADDALTVFSTGGRPSRVEAVAPAPNSHTAAASTSLTATVSGAVRQTTVTPQTFFVHGAFQGHLDGAFSFGGTADASDIVFDPAGDFHPGELVETSVTRGVVVDDEPLFRPYVWQFHTAVEGGSGRFADSGQRLGSSDSWKAALGDLDGDGDLDAFVGNRRNQPNKVWLNNGAGAFTDSGQNLGNLSSEGVALGDLDGDGDMDAYAANGAVGVPDKVWLNDGTSSFADSGQNLGDSYSVAVALGDVDGDGDLDAFIGNWAAESNLVWLNDGTGHFDDSGQRLGSSSSGDVALGDLDRDGNLDAFVANGSWGEPDQVWLNDGTGHFDNSGQSLGNADSLGVALGDVDGDGDLDAFVVHRKTGEQPDEVWFNDGTGRFVDSGQRLGTSWSDGVALGDLDGDGDLDAIVGNAHWQANEVWLNDGTGTFVSNGQRLGGSYSRAVPLGDLDGDGDLDIFVTNNRDQANTVWLNHLPISIGPSVQVDRSPASAGDHGLAIDGEGKVYVAYVDHRADPRDIFFNHSTDFGLSFEATDQQIGGIDSSSWAVYPNIAADTNDHVYVVWEDWRADLHVYLNRSNDGGATFEGGKRIDNSSSAGVPDVAADDAGHVYVSRHNQAFAWPAEIWIDVSTDYGNSFDLHRKASGSIGGTMSRIATDGSGNVYVVFAASRAFSDVYLNKSSDWGDSWGTPIRLGDLGTDYRYDWWWLVPNVAVECDRVYVAWPHHVGNDEWDIYLVRSVDGGQTFSAPVQANTSGSTHEPRIPSLAVDGDHVYLGWDDGPSGDRDLWLAISTDGGANFGTPIRIDDGGEADLAHSWKEIAAQDGQVYVTWVDNRTGAWHVRFARVVVEPNLNVRAFIDGRSRLIVQGDTVRWHHLDSAAPGRHGGADEPTYLNGKACIPPGQTCPTLKTGVATATPQPVSVCQPWRPCPRQSSWISFRRAGALSSFSSRTRAMTTPSSSSSTTTLRVVLIGTRSIWPT